MIPSCSSSSTDTSSYSAIAGFEAADPNAVAGCGPVPELTRSTDIKLNTRLSLQRAVAALSLSQAKSSGRIYSSFGFARSRAMATVYSKWSLRIHGAGPSFRHQNHSSRRATSQSDLLSCSSSASESMTLRTWQGLAASGAPLAFGQTTREVTGKSSNNFRFFEPECKALTGRLFADH
jgi:hypothetical protein